MGGMEKIKFFLASTNILMCSNAFHLTVRSAQNQSDGLILPSQPRVRLHWSKNRHSTANQQLSGYTSPDTCDHI